jgi:hypothetical protein
MILAAALLLAQEWYPLGEGYAWIYEAPDGKTTVKRVMQLEKDGDADAFVVEDPGYPGDMRIQVLRPMAGELRVVRLRRSLTTPFPWIQLPLEKGRRWSAELRPRDSDDVAVLDFQVVGEEDLRVPAGRFKATRVDVAGRDDGKEARLKLSFWLAPGTGEVKRTILVEERGKVELEQTLVLKAFERPRARK